MSGIITPSYQSGFAAPQRGRLRYPGLWRGCVGAWNTGLGPSGLVLRDHSGFGNHGTITNGPTWGVSERKYALDLDGVNDHIELAAGKAVYELVDATTTRVAAAVVCRVKLTGSPATRQCVLGDWTNAGIDETFRLEVSGFACTANKWGADIFGWAANPPTLSSSADAQVGKWTHIVVQKVTDTYNEMWIDGRLDATSNKATYVNTNLTGSTTIGRAGAYSGLYFTGSVCEVSIYCRALSPPEIRLLATRPGIAYELAPRKKSSILVPPFRAAWLNQRSQTIGGGVR